MKPITEKLACFTLDFEQDYGWRVQQFNILKENQAELTQLVELIQRLKLPLTAFITTHLLADYPETKTLLPQLAQDFHAHSHTHNTKEFNSRYEIATMKTAFEAVFGYAPLGYRAPLGVLREGDIDLLYEHGFRFSSSVFPSFRMGQFNNLAAPMTPFRYDNGLIEMPLAAVQGIRLIASLSYLKLLGYSLNLGLYRTFGLPQVVIFNTHLHDFIWNPKSFSQLPRHYQLAWGRNREKGMDYLERLVGYLRQQGYRFITMTELYERLADD